LQHASSHPASYTPRLPTATVIHKGCMSLYNHNGEVTVSVSFQIELVCVVLLIEVWWWWLCDYTMHTCAKWG